MFRKTIKGLFILLILFFVSSGLFGQNIQALRFGTPVSGNISGGGEYWYSVRPTSAGFVTVETIGDDVDTYMYAYNDNREEITSNDDGGEGYNAKITVFVPANQTYYFKVKGYNSDETGPYRIVANTVSTTALRLGSPVSGNISGGGEYLYSVRPTSNGFVTVETTGNEVDTYLHAYNTNGDEIATDDDGGEGYNARIRIPVFANQTYYFRLRGYDSDESGPYRITANFSADSSGRGESLFSSIPLQFASPVSGNISSGREYWYSVKPTSNGSITVETTGDDVDTYMYAYNATGALLDSNDDDGEGYNAKITISVSANQTYYFMVRGYDEDDTGPYRIVANFRR